MEAPKQIGFSHGLFVYPPLRPGCRVPHPCVLSAQGWETTNPNPPGAGCPILAFFLRKGGRPRPPRRFQPACQFDRGGLPKITLTQRTIKVSESSMMKRV